MYGTFVKAKGQKRDEPKLAKGKKSNSQPNYIVLFSNGGQVHGGKVFRSPNITVIIIYYDFTPLRVCPSANQR